MSVKRENVVGTPKRKRKVETVPQSVDSGPDNIEADGRPIKRLRVLDENTTKVISKAASDISGTRTVITPRGRKRYGDGKKGRTSSPHRSVVVNYDEIPAGTSPRETLSDATKVMGKGRVSAMKGIDGNVKGRRPLAKVKAKNLGAQREILPPTNDVVEAKAKPRKSGRAAEVNLPSQSLLERPNTRATKASQG
jgi:hypothetical protein